MKKFVLFSVAMLCSFFSYAQIDAPDIPKIFPASPEASNLGRFGEVPVNSAIGMASFSIPIHAIKEQGFTLPVSINYRHNGLVVDQIPGHLGMGWGLSAGGMITRQVKGRPDEDPSGYIGDGMTGANKVLPYVNGLLDPTERNEMEYSVDEGLIDTQPDKFIVSIGNLNATFYFDENRETFIIPDKPYLIEVINNDYSFSSGIKITDDVGIEYYFQELEETKRIPPVSLNEVPTALLYGYISGWKISEIKLTNNRSIYFSYDNQVHFQRTKSQSFKQRKVGTCGSGTLGTVTRDYEVESKIINEITFPKGKIVFNNTIVSVGSSNNTNMNKYLSYLNMIELKNTSNEVISTFNLEYDNITKTRKLLTDVKVNNDTNNSYTLEYEGVPPDDIHWAKQDFWGYYNSNPENYLINDQNVSDIYGNRAPDFSKSVLGSLKKITYPTKGYSEIIYESNTINPDSSEIPYDCQSATTNTPIFKEAHLNWIEQNNGSNYHSNQATFIIDDYQFVDLNLKVEKMTDPFEPGVSDGSIYGRVKARVEKTSGKEWPCQDEDCYGTVVPPHFPTKLGCEGASVVIGSPTHHEPGEETYSSRVKLDPGEYTLFVEAENFGVAYDVGDILRAMATVRVYEDDGNPPPLSVEVGGTRVSQIKSCPDSNPNNCIVKEYVYETEDGESLGSLFRKRNITTYEMSTTETVGGNGTCWGNWIINSSSSNVPLSFFMGSHVFYNNVIEKLNSNGLSQGYNSKNYSFYLPQQYYSFPYLAADHIEFKNGKLLKEKIYSNLDNLIAENNYEYQFSAPLNNPLKKLYFLAIQAISVNYTTQGGGGKVFMNNVIDIDNKFECDWLASTTQKRWEDGNLIENTTTNSYTNPQGHIKESQILDSAGDSQKTEYTYPYEINTGVYYTLNDKNRLSTPVITKQYENTNLLSTQKMVYRDWGSSIIAPEFIQTAKSGNSLEDRLIYYGYDTKGNPREVSKADGTRIVYVMGYDHALPVAKIENATLSDIDQSDLSAIYTASDTGTENDLLNALTNLRNALPNAQVTTYTYEPLIGVSTITDPGGYLVSYQYDEHNRLKYVKDKDGNVLSENEYNFKN